MRTVLKVLLFVTVPVWIPFWLVWNLVRVIWDDVSAFVDGRHSPWGF